MALSDLKRPSIIREFNAALNYFGGVPQSVKFDNMRQVVRISCSYEQVFYSLDELNIAIIEQLALHYKKNRQRIT